MINDPPSILQAGIINDTIYVIGGVTLDADGAVQLAAFFQTFDEDSEVWKVRDLDEYGRGGGGGGGGGGGSGVDGGGRGGASRLLPQNRIVPCFRFAFVTLRAKERKDRHDDCFCPKCPFSQIDLCAPCADKLRAAKQRGSCHAC